MADLKRTRGSKLAIALLGLGLLAAAPAGATNIFTVGIDTGGGTGIPQDFIFNDATTGIKGTINFTFDLSGDCTRDLSGSLGDTGTADAGCSFLGSAPYEDIFIFSVTLDGDSNDVGSIDVSAGSFPGIFDINGAGYFDSPGENPVAVDAQFTAFPGPGPWQGFFDFDLDDETSAANLQAGETSARLFITFPSGSLAELESSSIRFSGPEGAGDFMVPPVIVPEPGTFPLLGGGLAAMLIANSARRRRTP